MMDIADLLGIFRVGKNEALKRGVCNGGELDAAGLRAVVEALRDEIIPERMKLTKANNTCTRASLRLFFHKILGSDGGEKAAGGSTSNDERGLHALDTRPAAASDVCERWLVSEGWEYDLYKLSCIGRDFRVYAEDKREPCFVCGKPIKFVEAAR
jgi:hypothetical protein